MNKQDFTYWMVVEKGELLRFSELAHLMAKAMHPSDAELQSYGFARLNLDEELPRAVDAGRLRVRNAAGLGEHQFPHGDALKRAVMMPHDLTEFLAERGIGIRIEQTAATASSNEPFDASAYKQQEEEKRNAGRFTLEEAAALIAAGGNESEKQIVGKLVVAAERKELRVYEPGKNSPLEYGSDAGMASRVRPFYEECFWDELNTWLETFAPRVTFRFPKPTPDLLPGMLSARGINKGQVLEAFGAVVKRIDFKKALGNGKGLFGDCGARTQRGTPGGRHKALWNPVILAVGLKEKCYVTTLHLKMAFNDYSFLSDWAEEWADALELLGE